ncbi:tRNA (adenosine(37)-N6)-dimethylallyltransferase MiaA [Aquicella lusitana]|uniref:tRNA dimethylallyltransferase n=1 Tax=Aquicella lusitana TaxID=254246 RepID=A0A370GCT9_9COXI|nr:tRNA (adenosine(37)-N6)-dimethylallyltransferase MiaA [Aquicella lusitana]RDI41507.1 tRNA dimethylallyltransferase [Aquicella lusitana]VVC72599.1 tRNA dimethylallyltransferase [Aquicella lusitana]
MGPTASGKTPLAVELVQRFPFEIISVDSAMVYKGMDIGTAKPDPDTLKIAPHRLIDILDPKEAYSAGQFRADALQEISSIFSQGKIPLLVGGTMLYFRVLTQGLAALPKANPDLRAELQAKAERFGWEALHAELMRIDPAAANRIHPHDAQRIQRALEVYRLTGRSITDQQATDTHPLADYAIRYIGLVPGDRARLHVRIAERFQGMLEQGLLDEVRYLYERGDLTADLPSIRSVNYRQVWEYFSGQTTYSQMCERAVAATRQLAKRQLTWLRSWQPAVMAVDSESPDLIEKVTVFLKNLGP